MFKNIQIIIITLTAVYGTSYNVPGDFESIQSAIDASANGDSVIVGPGVYFESINFIGKEIVVSSRFEIDNDSLLIASTIIDGGSDQSDGSVCTFKNNEGNGSIIKGFTLQNGSGNNEDPDGNGTFYRYGGGIYCQGSSPIISDCVIINNNAYGGGGGGVFCYESSPLFFNCTIADNITDDVGGGLYARDDSSPQFNGCEFLDNISEYGGGCYLRSLSEPVMINTHIVGNTAANTGGGIVLKDDANLIAEQLSVIGNTSEGLGGGLYINNANPALDFMLVADNSASSGGGLYIRSSSFPVLNNATISNNSANLYGDGLYLRDNCEVIIRNSIIFGNNSNQIYFRDIGNEPELDIDHCSVEGGQSGIQTNDNADLFWGDNNIDQDPFFCNANNNNFYLHENSPCLTAGEGNNLIGCFGSNCGPINTGPVWYVGVNGNDGTDGSFENPFATIQFAIDGAVDGDTIRLTSGLFFEEIDFLAKSIVLESRAFELNDLSLIEETVISAPPIGGSCITFSGASNDSVVVRGITFSGGSNHYGGGIVIEGCSPTLIDVLVRDNSAEIGGGIYLSESNSKLIRVAVRNNGANLGGGVYSTSGNPIFDQVIFEQNFAYWGAGVYLDDSQSQIIGSRFIDNQAFIEGGGLFQTGGSSAISWTGFENNDGTDFAGAIKAHQTSMQLNQATFSGNIAGIGSFMSLENSSIDITNSIVWNNEGQMFKTNDGGTSFLSISYSDIEDRLSAIPVTDGLNVNLGLGNIDQDPVFCNPINKDYRLSDESVCRVMSSNGGVIGAYENSCNDPLALDDTNANILHSFNLEQNYPNPFNPSTAIKFSISEKRNTKLIVYNISGQEIKKLVNGKLAPGSYHVKWDGTNQSGLMVPSGIYIYSLFSGSLFQSKKMFLVK